MPGSGASFALASFCILLLVACSGDAGTDLASTSTDDASTRSTPDPPRDTAAATPSEPREASDTGDVIAQQLEVGLTNDPATVMSPEAEFTEDQAREGLPQGSDVKVHADSWSPVGASRSGVVVITVTQPSGLEGSFAAVVQLEGEEWKIISTFPLEEQR